jgi:hypothetical protein
VLAPRWVLVNALHKRFADGVALVVKAFDAGHAALLVGDRARTLRRHFKHQRAPVGLEHLAGGRDSLGRRRDGALFNVGAREFGHLAQSLHLVEVKEAVAARF